MVLIIEFLLSEPLALMALISGLICLGIYIGTKSGAFNQRVIILVGCLFFLNSLMALLLSLFAKMDVFHYERITRPDHGKSKLYQLVQKALDETSDGFILFNPPLKMRQGNKERVEARISVGDIGETLTDGLKGKGIPEKVKVKVGPIMKVRLYSNKEEFEITSYSNEEQAVGEGSYTQWEWDVLPIKYGNNDLHLKATISLSISGLGNQNHDLEVIDKTITVQVNRWFITKKFVVNNWQWISGTLIIPIIVWVYKSRLNKESKTNQHSKNRNSTTGATELSAKTKHSGMAEISRFRPR
jgi:hypothetical protein